MCIGLCIPHVHTGLWHIPSPRTASVSNYRLWISNMYATSLLFQLN